MENMMSISSTSLNAQICATSSKKCVEFLEACTPRYRFPLNCPQTASKRAKNVVVHLQKDEHLVTLFGEGATNRSIRFRPK